MRRAPLILALLAGLLAVGAHLGALQAGFLFDDAEVVRDNPVLDGDVTSSWATVLGSGWWQGAGRDLLWRPLTLATFAAQLRLGAGARGLHGANLLLHAVVTMLLFACCLRLLPRGTTAQDRLSLAAAFFAAALFAVHPLGSEAVTMVVGRADLLVAAGVLGTLLVLWAWRRQPRPALLAAAAILTAASCLAKENGFVLPLLALLALAPWIHRRPGEAAVTGRRQWWRRQAPALAAVVLPALAVLALRWLVLGRLMRPAAAALGDNPIAHAGFLAGRLTALHLLGYGARLFAWPHPLSVDYSHAALPVLPVDGALIVSTLAGLAALVVVLGLLTRLRVVLWGVLFFLAAQLLTANLLLPIGTMFGERLLYLPMAGLALALAALGRRATAAVQRLLPPAAWLFPALALLILAALFTASRARQQVYADDLTLWSQTVRAVPRSAKAHYNLARSLAARGRHDEAADAYRAALEILPGQVEALSNLAATEMRRDRPQAALDLLDEAARRHPASAQVAFNRALALERLGRKREAAAAFQRGRGLAPETARQLAAQGPPWSRWFKGSVAPAPPPVPDGG